MEDVHVESYIQRVQEIIIQSCFGFKVSIME